MALASLYVKRGLSSRELSRQLANSKLTGDDCALLRPLSQKSTLSIDDIANTGASHCVVVSSPVRGGKSSNQGEDSANGGEVALNGGVASLPCLRINNSNEGSCEDNSAVGSAVASVIPSWVRKSEFIVKSNIAAMVQKFGINHIGFLTLTFADDVQCHKQATKRFNSLATGVLNERYSQWVRVSERQKSGRWHFHLVVVSKQDIRRGVDFEAIKNRRYKDGANTALRTEWAFWRSTSKKYGFGRTELLPVRKTGEALAAYVAKYISKGFAFRQSQDKGARLVSYSQGARVCGSRFSFVGGRSHEWRLRCRLFLGHLYFRYYQSMLLQGLTPLSPFDYQDMPSLFGKRWAWRLRDRILSPMFFNPFY